MAGRSGGRLNSFRAGQGSAIRITDLAYRRSLTDDGGLAVGGTGGGNHGQRSGRSGTGWTGQAGPGDRDPGRQGRSRGAVRDRAPRGADLHAVPGRRAGARHHVPVPVRRVFAQADRRRGADPGPGRRGDPVAHRGVARGRAGDAAPGPGAQPAVRGGRRPAHGPAEPAAARRPLPGRGGTGPAAVRPASPGAFHVPGAARGHGPARRGRPGRSGPGPAADERARHRPARPGFRHGRAPVPVHRGGPRPPGRSAQRAVAVHRATAGAGQHGTLPLAGAGHGDRPGLRTAGHRHDPGAGRGAARALAQRPLRPVRQDPRRVPGPDRGGPVVRPGAPGHRGQRPATRTRRRGAADHGPGHRPGRRPVQRGLRGPAGDLRALLRAHRGNRRAAQDPGRCGGRPDAAGHQPAGQPDHHAPGRPGLPREERGAELRAVLRDRLPDAAPHGGLGDAHRAAG